MILLPFSVRKALPSIGANESLGLEQLAQVKFFTPDSSWTWYASEFDGDDLFFGLAVGFEPEVGYFQLSELRSIRGKLGLSVERDRFFRPQTLGELLSEHRGEEAF